MKLNPEAVRDVLLYLEQNLKIKVEGNTVRMDSVAYAKVADELATEASSNRYNRDEIVYAIKQLYDGGLIKASVLPKADSGFSVCIIEDITLSGHNFLNNIRPQSVWERMKQKLTGLGTEFSMDVLIALAKETILEALAN